MKIVVLISSIMLRGFIIGFAQDLRSGEISYQDVGADNYTIYASTVIYTQFNNAVNRPFILINWGDGYIDTLKTTQPTQVVTNVLKYIYSSYHTYINYGTYIITVNEPYYVNDISNILNSGSQALNLKKNVIIDSIIGKNSSPAFEEQVFKWACCSWIYNSGAYDPDGDSLSYSLVSPNVSNYFFPNATVDSIRGDLHFYPDSIGRYTIVIQVDEWRHIGDSLYNIGSTERQMLLDVNSLTGIYDATISDQLLVFPNPANENLHLVLFGSPKEGGMQIEIADMLGETIATFKEENFTGTLNKQINIANLSSGVYFVKVQGNEGVAVRKFVKG